LNIFGVDRDNMINTKVFLIAAKDNFIFFSDKDQAYIIALGSKVNFQEIIKEMTLVDQDGTW
jgi:hypothetical protein